MTNKPFQFGLATLFKAVTLVAGGVGVWFWIPWKLGAFAMPAIVVGTLALVFIAAVAACLLTGMVVLLQSALERSKRNRAAPVTRKE